MNPFELLTIRAGQTPDATVIASTRMKMSASEFLDVAERLGEVLGQRLNAQRGIVALDLEPELFAIATFACYRQGLTVCHFRKDVESLEAAACALVITQNAELFTGSISKLVLNEKTMQELAETSPTSEIAGVREDELANVFFSSGTTGVPKLIPVTFGDLLKREAFVRKCRIRGKYFSLLGNGTFGGFITMFSQVLNCQTYLSPSLPEQNLRLIQNWQVDTLFGSPAQLEALLSSAAERSENLELEEIQSTGNGLSQRLANHLKKQTGAIITNVYASTEAGLVAMKSDDWSDDTYCGEVIDGVDLLVVSPSGEPLPDGEIGELCVRAPGQSNHYLNNPTDTERQFRDGWFFPADLAILRGKSLFLMGRKLEIINAGGVKVNPLALDHLAMEYPGIDDCATFSFESGEGTVSIGLAFVSQNPPDPNLIRTFLARKFGEGAPQHFFRVAQIPRNELGKAMRAVLAETYKSRIA